MAKSLADQLQGAGLVDEKKAKQLKKQRRRKDPQQRKNEAAGAEEHQAQLQRERAEQAERDRELNRRRQAAEQARAAKAQVLQLLQQNRQSVDGDIRFNFADPRSKRIKHLHVSAATQERLARGSLAICADEENYTVVSRDIAERVAERLPEAVIFLADPNAQAPEDDDPYKDFPIPDDLMW